MLFINAEKHFEKGKRQNYLNPNHIQKIIGACQHRREEERYARRVEPDSPGPPFAPPRLPADARR